jgi:hypothetical protein
MDINIQKPIVKSTLFKKAKFRFVIDLDTTITYIEAPKSIKNIMKHG